MTPFLHLAFLSLALFYNEAFEIISMWIKFTLPLSYWSPKPELQHQWAYSF